MLAKVHLFSGLAPDALQAIAAISTEETHPLGTVIFEHGSSGDRFFLILEGKVRISRDVPGMGEEALTVLGPGDVFGEMCLFDDAPRSADARVHERCRILSVAKERFTDLLFLRMDLAHDVLWNTVRILSKRLRETSDKLTFLSISSKF
jgi:CRP/FNR family cyclic AMP-dependent transcriptional regulator